MTPESSHLWYDILDWQDGQGGTNEASFVYMGLLFQDPTLMTLTGRQPVGRSH